MGVDAKSGRHCAQNVKVIEQPKLKMVDLHGNPAPVGKYSGFIDV
jgi:hypothetical protein